MSELASVKRLGWSPYLGKTDSLVYVDLLGRRIRVQDFWKPAAEAMNLALIATGYENPCDFTGSYLKRYISGTTIWSWHSYGGAVDLDYGGNNPDSPAVSGADNNPHIHQPIPAGWGTHPLIQLQEFQVDAVLAIRTKNGKRVWRWLGTSIGDSMHFEPACSPADIATGIDPSTVPDGIITPPIITPPEGGTTMNYVKQRDGFGSASGDPDVQYWQTLLIDGLGQDTGGKDGKYGDKMTAAVRAVVPSSNGLQIGPAEAAAIHLALISPAAPVGLQRGDMVKLI